jgi:hypothetical protein
MRSTPWSCEGVSHLLASDVFRWAEVTEIKRRASNSFDVMLDSGETFRVMVDELPTAHSDGEEVRNP